MERQELNDRVARLSMQEIRELKESTPSTAQRIFLCASPGGNLVARCSAEAAIIKKQIGQEAYDVISSNWEQEELEAFLPFLLKVKGNETWPELNNLAQSKLGKSMLFRWQGGAAPALSAIETDQSLSYEMQKDAKQHKNSDDHTLTLYPSGFASSTCPKVKIGLGLLRMRPYVNNAYPEIQLTKPQFIAMFIARHGRALIPALTFDEE